MLYGREVLQKTRIEIGELLSKNLGSPIERERGRETAGVGRCPEAS